MDRRSRRVPSEPIAWSAVSEICSIRCYSKRCPCSATRFVRTRHRRAPHRPADLRLPSASVTHVFNASFEENRIGYTQSYENSLHFSPRFVAFVETLAERLSRTYALSGKTIVDTGCGKGDFLKRLSLISGAQGIGFDKSFEDNRGEAVPGVRFINDWFGDSYADLRPDLVVCRQVSNISPSR